MTSCQPQQPEDQNPEVVPRRDSSEVVLPFSEATEQAPGNSADDLPADLLAFAKDLREAAPDPSLSAGFAERLQDQWSGAWNWRSALNRSPMLRMAASILMLCAVAVPVAGMIQLIQAEDPKPTILRFEPAPPAPVVQQEKPFQPEAVPPEEPQLDDLAGDGYLVALEQSNRLRLLSSAWEQRFPLQTKSTQRDAVLGSLPVPQLQIAAQLRMGIHEAATIPAVEDWQEVSAPDLWLSLERKMAGDDNASIFSAPLWERVRQLWEEPANRRWLSGWYWIYRGEGLEAGHPWPSGLVERNQQSPSQQAEDLAVFWKTLIWQPSSVAEISTQLDD